MLYNSINQRINRIRICLALFVLLSGSLVLFSFKAGNHLAGDLWQQLGLSREQGTDNIKQSFLNGYLYYYGAKNAKNIAVNDRVAVAKELLSYAKQYVNSDAFKKEYDLLRASAKPQELNEKAPRTKEEIRKDEIAKTEKSIKEAEENMKKYTPEMQKAIQPVLDMLRKNLKDYKDPDNQMIELFYQGEKLQQEERIRSYKEYLQQWENNYPEDYRVMIKNRLQKFIDLASTVDFNAELKDVNGKKKFANPVYEAKAYDWKQIFRAGKHVTETAIASAQQWIKELSVAK